MEENQAEAVVATKKTSMTRSFVCFLVLIPVCIYAQNNTNMDSNDDKSVVYKKRVLENTEIDILTSFYTQDGSNAAVTGGIGTEKLNDFATNFNISIPLNDDDVLTIDATVSAYSSASSSNLNPFSGASRGDDDDDDDNEYFNKATTGSPWVASSGASRKDVWLSTSIGYSHSSVDRNKIYSANLSFASEYDYVSFGAGLGFNRLFNQKNSEIGLNFNLYLDTWLPQYPTELKTFIDNNGNLNAGFFNGIEILDNSGSVVDKNGGNVWHPLKSQLIIDKSRRTYSITVSFAQILNKRSQISLFSDIVLQQGWLANPMQRVYFADINNYYIGNALSIPNYENRKNRDVFQLADDIERLPTNRSKFPIGIRLNYYINEFIIANTYYRYYFDNWGIYSNTFNIEFPIKISDKFTFYPAYRFYNQTASTYFAPYESHISTQEFYTSDFDLSEFTSNQYGMGISYTDVFTKKHIWKLFLKNISLNYNYYQRNSGLDAHIVSLGIKFIVDK